MLNMDIGVTLGSNMRAICDQMPAGRCGTFFSDFLCLFGFGFGSSSHNWSNIRAWTRLLKLEAASAVEYNLAKIFSHASASRNPAVATIPDVVAAVGVDVGVGVHMDMVRVELRS